MYGGIVDNRGTAGPLERAQVENLYIDAMLLADEAHTAFAAQRDTTAIAVDPLLQVGLACEALKTTTRLMQAIAWLLHRRAMFAGDPGAGPNDSAARIGAPVTADWDLCARLDPDLCRIVAASERLFDRIATLEAGWGASDVPRPVQALLAQIAASL